MTTASVSKGGSTFDEASMQQSIHFSNSLKDLKNLRTQLYSAAEYFELSYTNDDQKQIVVETLKDYAIKAFVNTVDHLGSVSYKVNDLLDEKAGEVSSTELRVSCIEQRLRSCQAYADREGIRQQSLMINTPKHHKRYILPVGETMIKTNQPKSAYLDDKDGWHQFRNLAVKSATKESTKDDTSKVQLPRRSANFSFASSIPKKEPEKHDNIPLARSGSAVSNKPGSRSTTPTSRSATPTNRRYPSEPRKSVSMRIPAEKNHPKEFERQPSRSKRLLKALLTRRQSKRDDMLYTYLDEY